MYDMINLQVCKEYIKLVNCEQLCVNDTQKYDIQYSEILISRLIEQTAIDEKIDLLDSICHHCEETGLEFEIASSLISQSLKDKIREQSIALNLIKRESCLPI